MLVSWEMRLLLGLLLVGVNAPISDCSDFLSCELCIDLTKRSPVSSAIDALFVTEDTTDAADDASAVLSLLGFMGDAEGALVVDPVTDDDSDLIL